MYEFTNTHTDSFLDSLLRGLIKHGVYITNTMLAWRIFFITFHVHKIENTILPNTRFANAKQL